MDSFRERALKSLRQRHETQVTENAERIREHIGYVLKRVESGHADTVGLYTEDIAASAQRIRISVAALETLKESAAILATSDETETTGEQQ
jgi:hypothetical protein